MKSQFIECKQEKTAKDICPWADEAVKVPGGYVVIKYETDHEKWKADSKKQA